MTKNADEAKADYLAGKSYKDIATQYNVSQGTVRAWKSRYNWDDKPSATKSATQQENVATKTQHVAVDELSNNKELNEKQKLFCLYYLQRFNATWAYQQAYGGDYDTARNSGPRLIANDCIKEALGKLRKQQQAELFITATDILKEYIKQATSSLGDVLEYTTHDIYLETENGDPIVDKEGNPVEYQRINLKLKPEDEIDWSTIQDIHLGRDGLVVKLYDKQKAMKELIDRLPEPEIEDVKQDSFLKAIMSAKDKKDGESE